jgi:hypothetical protein
MKKKVFMLVAVLLLIAVNAFSDDVSIDSDGNVTTGTSSSGNLEVTGASAEDAIVGSASGTGARGVYGENITGGTYGYLGDYYTGAYGRNGNNYGFLGGGSYGVYGQSDNQYGVYGGSPSGYGVTGVSSSGYAGYFVGDTHITGKLTVDGSIGYTETDPVFSAWDKSTGISIVEAQITDLNHFSNIDETDPVFVASAASGITLGQVTNWDTAYGWGDHSSAGYDSTDDSWVGTGDVYTTSGNVGIGTDTPNGMLDVRGSICLNGGADCRTTWPTGTGAFTDTGSLAYYTGGNVGIGTTSPSEKLSVDGTIESTSGGIKFPDGTAQETTCYTAVCDLYELTGNTKPDFCFECSDGIDNDGDGLVDYPDDPECLLARDGDESTGSYKVFITSTTYDGDLNGVSGAHTKCQQRANAAGLTGTFKAWISRPGDDPSIQFSREQNPYVLVDDTMIATDWDDLVDGFLAAPINVDEYGNTVPVPWLAWTNTDTDGTVITNDHCNNWSDGTSNYLSIVGYAHATDNTWTNMNTEDCTGMGWGTDGFSLYCFQQ